MYEFNYTVGKNISNFSPLPAGIYLGEVIISEIKTSQAGNRYLNVTFEIQENEYQGRRVFERFNLWNSNPVAVEIAEKKFNQLCHAVGYEEGEQITDLNLLHHKLIRIHIGIDKKDKDRNVIYAFGEAVGYIDENPKNATILKDKEKEFNDDVPF